MFRSDLPDVATGGATLVDVTRDACERHGDRVAVIDDGSGHALTYAQLGRSMDRFAAWLSDSGAGRGDVVAIWAPNSSGWAQAALGAMAAGCAVSGVSPLATDDEVVRHLLDCEARVLVTVAAFAERALAARSWTNVEHIVVLDRGPAPEGATSMDVILCGSGASVDLAVVGEHDLALLPYSSGTTGMPKGVELTHGSLVSVLRQNTAVIAPTPDDVVLAIAPFPHIMGMVMTMLLPLSAGATVLAMPRYDADTFGNSVAEHGVTVFVAAPPMAPLFVVHPLLDPTHLPGVRIIAFGGAPLPADHEEAIAVRYPGAVVGQGWGMTELSVGATTPRPDGRSRPGSVGRLLPNTQLRVVDPDTGADLHTDQIGELWVRGPQVMRGYRNRPEETTGILTADGWIRTGDLGSIDSDGFVTIIDRMKDLIKVKGYQVAPAELEAVLVQHPQVQDAAVIRGERNGHEVPIGFVVAAADLDLDALRSWFAERVSPYKALHEIHRLDGLPRNMSGKLLRRQLDTIAHEPVTT
jgi:acyl-CoA synthetase (AMP-forming)/AMP-acid ligase II